MENQSLTKLKSLAHFLKISNRIHYQNFNLFLFINFLNTNSEISIILNSLMLKFPKLKESFQKYKGSKHVIELDNDLRKGITEFEEWVAYCFLYINRLTELKIRGNLVVDNFISNCSDVKQDNEKKLQFYNDCIEPILIYVELQIKHSLNSINILRRYKILCEWYDRQNLIKKDELNITKNHLSKYLFDQGFTYSLAEVNVGSGRIDNLGINAEQLSNLPEAIVIEGKILDGKNDKSKLQNVKDQVEKRINELNFKEGFCVVYNKSENIISIKNLVDNLQGFPFLLSNNRRIFFVFINLNEIFYESKSTLKNKLIEIK